MTDVYFTSDTHFSHAYVAELRGFATPEEHDESIVAAWNATVSKRDVVYHLGDVTLKNVKAIAPLLARLNGTIHLVAGNHDRVHPIFRNAHARQHDYLASFATVSTVVRLKLGERSVLLSHFPFDGEGSQREREDRHVEFRLRDTGIPLIHGHTHDERQRFSRSLAGTPMFHVGWDAFERPVSAVAIATAFDRHDLDLHPYPHLENA